MELMAQWKNTREAVNPDMIILARESRGLSQMALADALGVTQGYLSKIEKGFMPLTDEKIEMLSRILDYPTEFFFQSGSLMGMGITEIYHRKRQDVPQKLMTKIHACVEVRIRNIAALLRSIEVEHKVPTFDMDEYHSPSEIARLVRAYWHVPRGPIRDLTQTLESFGVIVVPMDVETPKVDAISRWLPGMPPIFCVNMNVPKDRLRWSLAHELGHMVMHRMTTPNMEDEADKFTAEFLLPEQEVSADLIGVDISKLAQLKRYWGVSMNALLKRADDLGMISKTKARSLWQQMAKAGYRTREPIELGVQGEHPWLLHQIIKEHLTQLSYTVADMAHLFALNEREVWSFYLHDQEEIETPDRRRRIFAV